MAEEFPDLVRFDAEENATAFEIYCPYCGELSWGLPVVARIKIDNSYEYVPADPNDALHGWMYFNLNNDTLHGQPSENAIQSWVVVSFAAEGRFSVDFDATALGNGCSPRTPYTAGDGSAPAIGPAPNINPR